MKKKRIAKFLIILLLSTLQIALLKVFLFSPAVTHREGPAIEAGSLSFDLGTSRDPAGRQGIQGILPESLSVVSAGNSLMTHDDFYRSVLNLPLEIGAPGVLANDSIPVGSRAVPVLVETTRNGTLTLRQDGSFTYSADPDFSGIDRFRYRLADGIRESGTATVFITVPKFTERAPVAPPSEEATITPETFSAPRIAAITDFSETVDGVLLSWEKAYYQDLDIAGTTALEIPFGVNRPSGYIQGLSRYPLVVYLHGAGARSNWTSSDPDPGLRDHSLVNQALKRTTARFFAKAAQTQTQSYAFVLAPQVPTSSSGWVGTGPDAPYTQTDTPDNTWSEYMHLLENLIVFLTDSTNNASLDAVLEIDANDIDPDRIYVVGDSDGAKGTWDILARQPSLFAGGIAASGTGPANRLDELRQTPLWSIHGTLDDSVPNELPSESKPLGSGTLGMLALLDPGFDNTGSTDVVYKDDPDLSGDDPFASDVLIYSEFDETFTHSEVAVGWTGRTSGTLPWLFAQSRAGNSRPVAYDQSQSTTENTPVAITLKAEDSDGDSLTYSVATAPSDGTLSGTAPELIYTPDSGFTGKDSFTFTASDGTLQSNTATVTISVNAGTASFSDAFNRADSESVGNGWTEVETTGAAVGIVSGRLVFTDASDVTNRPMVSHSFTTASAGKITWNFDFDWARTGSEGTYRLFMQLGDGSLMSDSSQDAGVAVDLIWTNIGGSHEMLGYRSSGTTSPIAEVSGPAHIMVEADLENHSYAVAVDGTVIVSGIPFVGTFPVNTVRIFTDALNESKFTGRSFDNLEIRLQNGTGNTAPSSSNDGYKLNEDTALSVPAPGVLANDTDADGDPLSSVFEAGPSNGTLSLNSDGSFTYSPDSGFTGSDSFTYHANDGTADSNTATVALTVDPVNDAPVAADDAYTTDEDTILTVAAPGVLANDTDADGDPLSSVFEAGPSNGTLSLNADGSFTYSPDSGFTGSDSFTYHASDGAADSNTATVSLTVNPVNDGPVAADDAYTTDEDTILTVAAPGVLANDTDGDGDTLTAVPVTGPSNGTLTLNTDGSFTYTPDPDFHGDDNFTYHANDGTTDGNTATVSLTVNPVNDVPVAADDAYTTDEDTPLTVAAPGVLGNDTDVDGDPLSSVFEAGPSNGTLSLNADGSFTYTPDSGFTGSDSFTYHVSDGAADSNTATVSLTVTEVNVDQVVIIVSEYKLSADQLEVQATSSSQPDALLILEGYGTMDLRGTAYVFKDKVEGFPNEVTVVSNRGGTATATVTVR